MNTTSQEAMVTEFLSLRATFGKLQNAELSLSPGLNVLYAPNESGKSTWCQWLRVMLYGLQGRGDTADRARFAPWNGSAMSGSMEVAHRGIHYNIVRSTRRASAPMGSLQCYYADTVTACDALFGQTPGEVLLGVPLSVYQRSSYIGQGSLRFSQSPDLEKRITSLLTSGEEDTSFSETYDRLRKQLNQRRHNQTGQLPRLEAEIRAIGRQLEQLDSLNRQLAQLQQQQEACEDALSALEKEALLLADAEAYQRRAAEHAKLQALQAHLREAEAAYAAHPLYGRTAQSLQEALSAAEPEKLPNRRTSVALCCTAAAMLCTGIGSLLQQHTVLAVAAGAVFLAAIGGIAAHTIRYNRALRRNLTLEQKRSVLQAQMTEAELLRRTVTDAQEAYRQYRSLADNPDGVLPAAPPAPGYSRDALVPLLAAKRQEAAQLRSRADMLSGQLSAAGDGAALTEQLQQKQLQHRQLQQEYDAIAMAMSVLSETNTALQNRFSPELGRRTAEIFSTLTGGRYRKVLLSRELQMEAATAEDPIPRGTDLLSQGAADQLYLAARLAICELVLPEDAAAPLILDDALLTFDDTRLHAALDYLLQLSRTRQILLFTCQHRESDYLQGKSGVHFAEL